MHHQQMGPMIAMTQVPCNACQQTGSVVTQPCGECKGKRLVEEETVLEGNVKPGMKDGDRIVFPGKCSQSPQFSEPGDVILVIREADDKIWKRDGDNLTHDIQISMAESLIGFERNLLNHPSGKPLHIECNQVMRHTDIIQLDGWGMPNAVAGHGKLIVRCSVTSCEFTENQRTILKTMFAAPQTDHNLD
jgi:DnaJ-class molecular chaperone